MFGCIFGIDHQVIVFQYFGITRASRHSPAVIMLQLPVGGNDLRVFFSVLNDLFRFFKTVVYKFTKAPFEWINM